MKKQKNKNHEIRMFEEEIFKSLNFFRFSQNDPLDLHLRDDKQLDSDVPDDIEQNILSSLNKSNNISEFIQLNTAAFAADPDKIQFPEKFKPKKDSDPED